MRECGILMPISSLPGPGGIGTLGKPALDFVDFLADAGQQIWQILPVGPTGYGDSPYQSCSAFAGNPYFVDPDSLCADGLLKKSDYAKTDWGSEATQVDYGALYNHRFDLLRLAYENFKKQRPLPGCDTCYPDDWYTFTLGADAWLPGYCEYMAAKKANKMQHWLEWPAPLRRREPAALEAFRAENADEIGFWAFVQYEFDRQWRRLKAHAHQKKVSIMGDIPLYVSADSADAWTGGKLFELDAEGKAARVAGCPPDYFSADGQLWGNPLYDWDYHRQTGFAWWTLRIRHSLKIYDLLRIDHFRGFDTYWAVPAADKTARGGKWEQGPGMELFDALRANLGELPIIAEDLGLLFPSVRELLAKSGFPGMKVLQFAFSDPSNEYLPHNHVVRSVVYPGTHDNTTIQDWLDHGATPAEKQFAIDYLGLDEAEGYRSGVLRAVLASVSERAIIPLADWLGLGAEGHLNTPGRLGGNWTWRAKAGVCTPALARQIRTRCACYGRTTPPAPQAKAAPAQKTERKADKAAEKLKK